MSDWKALPVTHRAVISDRHLDEMGHMNVMWYTHLFSEATGGLFDRVGMTRDYFESHQAGSFALEEHVRYLAEVRAGQAVTVRSRLLGCTAKRLHMLHFLSIDAGDVLAATGEFVGAHIDMRVRRMAPFPEPIAAALDRLLQEHRGLGWAAQVCGVMKP